MYIGIDLGDKRCGLAVSVEGIAISKGIILRPKLVTELKKLIIDYKVQTLVVGLPYDLYGNNTKQLNKTQVFMKKLQEIFPDLTVVGEDERYTSFEADMIAESMGNAEKRDDISAILILESYLKKI